MNIRRFAINFSGLTLPLPIFIDPKSSYLLASNSLTESNLAIPISSLALIIALTTLRPQRSLQEISKAALIPIALYPITAIIIAMLGAFTSEKSLLFGLQWALPFFWLPVFLAFRNEIELKAFCRSFTIGSLTSVSYITLAGFAEIALYGGLQDAGRMTQNLILPGQYQLYVYAPTIIAFSTLLSNILAKASLSPINTNARRLLNTLAFIALIFTGAREGLLVYALGLVAIPILHKPKAALILLIAPPILAGVVYTNLDNVVSNELLSEIRLINKLLALREDGKELGGRDEMAKIYLSIIAEYPYLGTRMLPPAIAMPNSGIEAPSAHNYYIDTTAWGGITLAAPLLLLISTSLSLSLKALSGVVSKKRDNITLPSIGLLMLLFLLVSNNLNVPLRQPLTGPIFVLLYFLLATQVKFKLALRNA